MSMRAALPLSMLIASAWLLACGRSHSPASSGSAPGCGPQTCTGCCAADGTCRDGVDAGACGASGALCAVCEADETCSAGTCQLIAGCIANSAACAHSADCCSAFCSSAGTCTASPGGTSGGTTSSGGVVGCTAPASYDTANGSTCGSFRWPVKTGTDPGAASVVMNPTVTTIGALDAIPAPAGVNNGPDTRFLPTEGTLYELKNVKLIETKLEPDSDYHLPITDGTASMEVEIPYPGCVGPQSPWGCEITHARAALEKVILPTGSYQSVNKTVTVIGVAFFDTLHGSASQAPNGIELHPVLALCFGQDCDPLSN